MSGGGATSGGGSRISAGGAIQTEVMGGGAGVGAGASLGLGASIHGKSLTAGETDSDALETSTGSRGGWATGSGETIR